MAEDNLDMLLRLVAALLAGAIVGYERSYRGRPAGFRTHALVCTASSLLMLVTVYESHWMSSLTDDSTGTSRLAGTLNARQDVHEFRITPAGA